jgi:CheY-like chemotaxis protein
MTRKIIVVPDDLVVRVLRQEVLVRCRELRADQQGEDAADRKEHERRPDVEQPDLLVVDCRQPRCDLASPPVGAIRLNRFDVHGHQPLPPVLANCFV